jgi:dTDP-4-dehydrorhamnose reductase
MTSRVLFLGGSGQLGQSFQTRPVPATWTLSAPSRAECDFTQPSTIAKTIQDFAPDLVINAAAMTDVDACETDIETATEINFRAVAHIAAQCATLDAPLIHLSTDYVFDGTDGSVPYLPDDQMNPLNMYGQTKMMGEEAVRHSSNWHVIVRTSSVFSALGNNILTRTLQQIDTQDKIQGASNQIANPTSAEFLSTSLIKIAEDILNGKAHGFGTFHICGQPFVSRFEWVQAIMQAYSPFTKHRPAIFPFILDNTKIPVPRPLFSALNSDKAQDVYGITPSAWRDDLRQAVSDYVRIRQN